MMLSLHVEPVAPIWLLLIVLFVLTAFFGWNEFRRKLRFRGLRMGAQLLAMMALLGLLLRPYRAAERSVRPIVLLTENYSEAVADSLGKTAPTPEFGRAKGVKHFDEPELNWSEISALGTRIQFVLGEGIPIAVLDAMPQKNFKFFPASPPSGITKLAFSQYYAERTNFVDGIVRSGDSQMTIRLDGPGGAEDSVSLKPHQNHQFHFAFRPRQAGRFVYHIQKIENGVVTTEDLPIEVQPENKLRILFLYSYPTTEIKYLKNYLASQHHELVVRYKISQNSFRYETANGSSRKAEHLSEEFLRGFDLIFADTEMLNGLTPGEKITLDKSVREGNGLILTGNLSSNSTAMVPHPDFSKDVADTVNVSIGNGKKAILPALKLGASVNPSFQVVAKTTEGRAFSGFMRSGTGRVGYQLLQELFSVQLRGDGFAYTQLWDPLIEQVARSKNEPFKLSVIQFPCFSDDPISVDVVSTGRDPRLSADSISVPLREDASIDDLWHGKFWPSRSGWHSLTVKADTMAHYYYINEAGAWRSLDLSNQAHLNSNFDAPKNYTSQTKEIEKRGIPPIFFLLLFLCGAAVLWLVPRL